MTADYSLLRPEILRQLLPLGVALAGSALATLAGGRYLWRRLSRLRLAPLNELGTSELEFALAFPFFLMTVLTTVQISLLINATLMVDYAAFCATRSAAVWLSQSAGDEPAYTIADARRTDSAKWTRIRRAAVMAVIPISPRASGMFQTVLPPGVLAGFNVGSLSQLAGSLGGDGGVNYARLAADLVDKWPYAAFFTDVELLNSSGASSTSFPAGAPLTGRVTHKFYMNVPFAGAALGAALGERYVGWRGIGVGPYYVPVSAAYTLEVAQG